MQNATGAYRLACSQRVPHGILKRADDWWRITHPDTPFSGYQAPTPSIWFKQQLGLVTCNVVSSHILRAHGKNRRKAPLPTDTTDSIRNMIVDYDGPSMNYPEDSNVPAALFDLNCLPRLPCLPQRRVDFGFAPPVITDT